MPLVNGCVNCALFNAVPNFSDTPCTVDDTVLGRCNAACPQGVQYGVTVQCYCCSIVPRGDVQLENNLEREKRLRADVEKNKRKLESDLRSTQDTVEELEKLKRELEETVRK